jgi:3D (Asp-Asp-Asp) domain-containing protein
MVRKKIIGLFFLFVTFFPARLTYSKTDFRLAVKIPVRKFTQRFVLFSHRVSASVYFPDEAQTDDSPLVTADGSKINKYSVRKQRWIAVSRNLLKRWGGRIQFGDSVMVNGISEDLDGAYIVRDTMNKRLKNTIDILVGRHDNIMGHWKNVKVVSYRSVTIAH